jgi:hypothetical protein
LDLRPEEANNFEEKSETTYTNQYSDLRTPLEEEHPISAVKEEEKLMTTQSPINYHKLKLPII